MRRNNLLFHFYRHEQNKKNVATVLQPAFCHLCQILRRPTVRLLAGNKVSGGNFSQLPLFILLTSSQENYVCKPLCWLQCSFLTDSFPTPSRAVDSRNLPGYSDTAGHTEGCVTYVPSKVSFSINNGFKTWTMNIGDTLHCVTYVHSKVFYHPL